MEQLGLSPEALHAINPRLIYCSLSAFGHKGPLKNKLGYEISVQAFAGLWSVNGWEKGPTSRVGVQVLDLGTGVWAALGCLAAVLERGRTGKGVVVSASLYETGLSWLMIHAAAYSASGKLPVRSRGSRQKVVVYDVFQAADGDELLIAASNDRLFAKLAAALGRPEWAADPRFKANAGRLEHKDYLLGETASIVRTASVDDWIVRLEAAGVPCSPVNNLEQVLTHPQTEALGIYEPLTDDPLRLVGLPISFDGVRPSTARGAPALGNGNASAMGGNALGGQKTASS
jgi:crotonobetainyl-CoA:carnitine CoA-transferase CaiB-like acyl-CoA transferase